MGFHDLPPELILKVAEHVRDIKDHMNLSSSSRKLRSTLEHTDPKAILRLAAAASRTFFQPSPHFLIAATAKQLSSWAAASSDHVDELRNAFRGGNEALLELCIDKCELTISDIRRMHEMRFSTINPIVDMIAKAAGKQWYATPNFWHGGVEYACTVDCDPPETFFHLATYGGLFGPALNEYLDSGEIPAALDIDSRLEYVKYCIPDWACHRCQPNAANAMLSDRTYDPRRKVDRIGPYVNDNGYPGHQFAARHVLACRKWRQAWRDVREHLGGDFQADWQPYPPNKRHKEDGEQAWKQDLWEDVVMMQGLEGMDMIANWTNPGGVAVEKWRSFLDGKRSQIARKVKKPREVAVGRQITYEWPSLRSDLSICMSGFVSGS